MSIVRPDVLISARMPLLDDGMFQIKMEFTAYRDGSCDINSFLIELPDFNIGFVTASFDDAIYEWLAGRRAMEQGQVAMAEWARVLQLKARFMHEEAKRHG